MYASSKYSRLVVLELLVAAVAPERSRAQGQHIIRLIVPFTPGTGPDLLGRIVGDEMRQRLNKAVIVENKPGASGNIGTQAAARATPDGQTLMVTISTFVMNASFITSIP